MTKIKFTEKDILERSVEEIIEKTSLKKRMKKGKLRVKLGIDPTGPDLHLGHSVNLWKLRQFQQLGHTAVLIIGDYTASIGDPSGKDETRPPLSEKEIKENYRTYEKQALKILDKKNLEVRRQTEWFKGFSLKDFIKLASKVSVGRLFQHETFRKRLEKGLPFAAHEPLYPLLQGYDSVAIRADVEIGASEQKFNILMGRDIQRAYRQEEQEVILTPYLLGTDGKEKMSKSLGNYIALNDDPADVFGKVMRIEDKQIIEYFEHTTSLPFGELQKIKEAKPKGKGALELKKELARHITELYHGTKAAERAQKAFEAQFQKKETPQDMPVYESEGVQNISSVMADSGMASSKSEARRLIEQGGVYFNDERVVDPNQKVDKDGVLRVGRRKQYRIKKK